MKDHVRLSATAAVIYLLGLLLIAGLGVVYSNIVAQQNNHKWCDMLNTLHSAYEGQPQPTTDVGKRYKVDLEQLRDKFGC